MSLIITNSGKQIALNRLVTASPTYSYPNKFKVGIGNQTLTSNLSDLVIPTGESETSIDAMDATTGWTCTSGGLVSLNTTTKYEGTGSINLYKTGNAYDVTMYKAISSFNFTGKVFSLWLYIKDTAVYDKLLNTFGALSIELGSTAGGATNKYQYYWSKSTSNLASSVGNWVKFSCSQNNPYFTVGSPNAAAIIYVAIKFPLLNYSTMFAAGDIIIDKLGYADSIKTITSATTDTTAITSKVKSEILTTESNSLSLTEFGLFNNDTEKKNYCLVTHPGYAKTNSYSLVYYWKEVVR
jgi:hypothetical protein